MKGGDRPTEIFLIDQVSVMRMINTECCGHTQMRHQTQNCNSGSKMSVICLTLTEGKS